MQRLLNSKLRLALAGVLVLAAVLGGVTFLGKSPLKFEISIAPNEAAKQGVDTAHAAGEKHGAIIVYNLGDRVVNLADTGMLRYLRVNVALEFASDEEGEISGEQYKKKQEEFTKKLINRKERMEDIVTTVLSSHTAADVITAAGKEAVRAELKDRLTAATAPERLLSVYFTQFIIQ